MNDILILRKGEIEIQTSFRVAKKKSTVFHKKSNKLNYIY